MANERELITVADCKSIIKTLARSQGFYERLWNHLMENNLWGEFAHAATKANCHDGCDLVLWIEQ